jgi:hypothetical protein
LAGRPKTLIAEIAEREAQAASKAGGGNLTPCETVRSGSCPGSSERIGLVKKVSGARTMSKLTITASAYFDKLLASKKLGADVDRYLYKVFRVGTIEMPLTDLEAAQLRENMLFALALAEIAAAYLPQREQTILQDGLELALQDIPRAKKNLASYKKTILLALGPVKSNDMLLIVLEQLCSVFDPPQFLLLLQLRHMNTIINDNSYKKIKAQLDKNNLKWSDFQKIIHHKLG